MKIILVADNDGKRTKGLMGTDPLKEDECAYFHFEKECKPSFWNNNVSYPISLIFLDKVGKVKDIKYLEANQLSSVYPKHSNIKHVIEAHKNAPDKFNIKIDSIIEYENGEIVIK